jgi:hypothetical protein
MTIRAHISEVRFGSAYPCLPRRWLCSYLWEVEARGEELAPVLLLAIFGIFAFTMRSIILASRVLLISAEPNVPIRDIITRLSNAILA